MKNTKLILSVMSILLLSTNFAFGQQDTTFVIDKNGNIGIGTSNPNIQGHSLTRKVLSMLGPNDGAVIEMGSKTPANGIGVGRLNFYNSSTAVTSLQIDSNPGSSNTGNFQVFTNDGSGIVLRMLIASDGNVGIGTSSPKSFLNFNPPLLNIKANNGPATIVLEAPSVSGGVLEVPGNSPLRFYTNNTERFRILGNGNVGIGTSNPSHPLQMGSGAHVTAGGVWTNASSRELKENIRELTAQEAIETLSKLSTVKFNYKVDKNEEYVGFIAEEVPDLVATKDRRSLSPMDIVAVLAKVVQIQQKKIEELEKRLNFGQ